MNPLMNNSCLTRTNMSSANPIQFFSQFMRNPVGALRQVGYTIPEGMNDPRQIVDHLINNGQLNNSTLSQLQKIAKTIPKMR